MEDKKSDKPFVIAFLAFVFLLVVSVVASSYVRLVIDKWDKTMIDEVAKNAVSLADNRFNLLRLNSYGLMQVYQNLDKDTPEVITALNKNKVLLDSLGKLSKLSGVSTEASYSGLIGKKHFEEAFEDNRPVFFNASYGKSDNLGILIPVNKSKRTYVYGEMPYEDIFLPIGKTSLLDGIAKYEMKAYVKTENNLKETYTMGVKTNDESHRRHDGKVLVTEELYLDHVNMVLKFSQSDSSPIVTWIRQIPFTLLVAGTLLSVLTFGVVFLGMISTIDKRKG